MALALEQAEEAARAGEVPVGAVAVVGGKAVVSARNRVEERRSATAHAELELLHKLELLRGDWRMEDVTVYVTKEPCPMCVGALVNARVRRIVYGAADPRFGGCSVFGIPAHPGSLWKPEVTPEICAAEARNLLAAFFREARSAGRELPIRMRNGFDPEYAVQLNVLMREVFDFDFDFWFRRGMWSDKYESFSLIDAGRMVAHVGVSRMKLRVKGKEFFAIQLGGVATSPEARGQGHMRRLLGGVLRRYAETPVFLFANDSVSDFYPKFGFSAARTMRPVARLSIDNPFEPERCTPDAAAPLAGKRRFPSMCSTAGSCAAFISSADMRTGCCGSAPVSPSRRSSAGTRCCCMSFSATVRSTGRRWRRACRSGISGGWNSVSLRTGSASNSTGRRRPNRSISFCAAAGTCRRISAFPHLPSPDSRWSGSRAVRFGRHLESQKNGNRLSRPVPVEIPGPVRSKSGNFRGGVVTDC